MTSSPGPRTTVRDYNGLPTLHIDDVPSPAFFYMTYGPQARHFRAFAEIGVGLSSFSATGDECPYGICAPTWVAEDRFDYTQFDERMAMACSADGTLVMPRVYTGAPKWWMDRYPEECVVYSKDVSGSSSCSPVIRAPSFASRRWREASAYAVCALIDHIESGPWGDRILGYHIAGGITEEFAQWGSDNSICADYSEVNQQAFGEWLKQRYGTQERLRAAWNDVDATFEAVRIPTKDERDDADTRVFYDPRIKGRIIDFGMFNGEMIVDFIDQIAQTVKRRTNGSKIVGSFFGYVLGCSFWDRLLLDSGYLAIGSLLQKDSIDFLTSPSGYDERSCGYGSSYFRAPVQSIQRAGKLWISENDVRTHLTSNSPEAGQPIAKTIAVQQREAALCLTGATGQWWFDMGGGWYDDADTMSAIERINRVAESLLHADRRSGAEVAMVLDAESLYYCPPITTVSNCFAEGLTIEMNRVGTPVDRLLLEDALDGPDYKLYIMSGCFAPTDAQRQKIREKLLQAGKTVVWLYAPGYVHNNTMSAEHIHDLTGIQVRLVPCHNRMLAHTDGDIPGPIRRDVKFGHSSCVSPFFEVVDPEAQTWGYLRTTGTVGLACKNVNGANSIYSTVAPIDSAVLRDIARFAGVHVYLDTSDPSYFSRSLIGVHACKAGVRRLDMPDSEPIYDIINDKALTSSKSHDIALAAHSTGLYFRGTKGMILPFS